MLEYDWFLTAHIYSLILLCNSKTVRFDLSDYQKLVIGQVKSDSQRTNENQVANATSQWNFTTWPMIANQNQWKNCDQVSCPASTGQEKRMKLTGPVTFIQTFFSLGFNSLFKVAELSFGSFWV